ncbi:MAG: hypothetical protein SVR94_17075, partial [Pseudomonadota bacterium]|nr:hypothetical protein [Pseudomonadota bacterium]
RFIILDQARIIARAVGGDGGNITIKSEQFVASEDSIVDASSQKGIDGNIIISAPDVNISGKLVILSTHFLNAAKRLQALCRARSLGDTNSLVVTQSHGAPNSPYNRQSSGLSASKPMEKTPSRPVANKTTPPKVRVGSFLMTCASPKLKNTL